jgi:hypothetical protein
VPRDRIVPKERRLYKSLTLALLILLPLVVGIAVYRAAEYRSATLVIRAKTLEKGGRSIYLTGKKAGQPVGVPFEIGSAEGDSCIYPIELPRLSLDSIRIPPLASPGAYEIEGVSLATDSVTYRWDEKLVCTQRQLIDGIARTGPCRDNAPGIAVDRDAAVVISSIPAAGSERPFRSRLTLAGAVAAAALLAVVYLLLPVFRGQGASAGMAVAVRGGWLLVCALFGYQLFLLGTYAVDIPYYEEWEFFDPAALPNGLTVEWLSRQISHQRMMVYTKLMAWLNFKLFSLDFVTLKLMNYAVFGCLLAAVAHFRKRVLGDGFPLFPLFMVFLLAPIAHEVHAASFQSGETFVVLCSLLMLSCLIRREPTVPASLTFSFLAIAAMYSLSAGLVYALVFLVCDSIFTLANISGRLIDRTAGLRHLLLRWAITLPAMLVWILGYKKPEATWGVPDWLLPWEGKFWDMFLNLLGFGFGVDGESPLPGIIWLAIVIIPVILLLKEKQTRWEPSTWQVTAAIAGSLAAVALITVGRGNMGFSIKVSRYVIFGFLLVPYTAMAWWLAVRSMQWRRIVMIAFWGMVAAAYCNNWDYGVYRDIGQQELQNLECVERYNNRTGDGVCPGSFVLPIGTYFDNAKALGIHFTRQFAAPKEGR